MARPKLTHTYTHARTHARTQYFDTLNVVGNNPSTNTIFMPHKFAGTEDLADQVRDGAMAAAKVPAGRLVKGK